MSPDRIATKEDLQILRQELVRELRQLVDGKFTQDKVKDWLRPNEVCDLLGISNSTLHNYRVKGILNPKKVGGGVFYSREEINSLFEER